MENKTPFVMKPGTREPRKKLGARDGYNTARRLGFFQIGLLLIDVFFKHILYFKGTIWAKSKSLYQELPDKAGFAMLGNNNEMNITVKFYDWRDFIEPYYFLHLICANAKYVILLVVCLKIGDLFKLVSEKRIFEEKNFNTLRLMGFLLLTIPFFENLAIYLMTQYVSSHPELFSKLNITLSSRLELFPNGYIWYFFYAQVFYLAIIEILRYGIQLKSENDLTV